MTTPPPGSVTADPAATSALFSGAAAMTALRDIKLAHSVFALPFAIAGAFVAREAGALAFAGQLVLVVVCMVCARTWAMLVNRLADRRFDAENPRTARRAVASGALGVRQGWALAALSAGLFCLVCALFWALYANPWPAYLSVPVLAWIALYSYTKRFTALCHVFLGGALAVSPLAAAIAVGGIETLAAHAGVLVPVACFVALWVGGFDVAYALQDLDFDRDHGLRSVPAALGPRGALWVARAMHFAAWGALLFLPSASERLGVLTWAGIAIVGGLLVWEHAVLARRGVRGLPLAFFTINGVVSCVFGLLLAFDILT